MLGLANMKSFPGTIHLLACIYLYLEKGKTLIPHFYCRALATTHPQQDIILVQHRPAWLEQLVMRIAGVKHIVVNSCYAATEATGPLPYLQNSQILVGQAGILDYLKQQGNCLDQSLTPLRTSTSRAYTALISRLEPVLLSLRFASDAWEQVYRRQYIQASGAAGRFPLASWFQAWSVRNVALKQLIKVYSVEESMAIAREVYQSLETQLDGHDTLLHTTSLTTVDAILWAHLADALCNVHLVMLLADFPILCKYFSRIYDTYFRLDTDAEWKVWNQQQNLLSPFQQLPVEVREEQSTFHNALELMQSFSVHTHDLPEVLSVAQKKRASQDKLLPAKRESTLYRWRMGGSVFPKKMASREEPETPQQQELRKAHKHNDELWLSAVIGVTAMALFFGTTTRTK